VIGFGHSFATVLSSGYLLTYNNRNSREVAEQFEEIPDLSLHLFQAGVYGPLAMGKTALVGAGIHVHILFDPTAGKRPCTPAG
jgi:hypothetical protein